MTTETNDVMRCPAVWWCSEERREYRCAQVPRHDGRHRKGLCEWLDGDDRDLGGAPGWSVVNGASARDPRCTCRGENGYHAAHPVTHPVTRRRPSG